MKRGLGIAAAVVAAAVVLIAMFGGGEEPVEPAGEPEKEQAEPRAAARKGPPPRARPAPPPLLVSPARSVEGDSMALEGSVVERKSGRPVAGAELVFEGEGGAHSAHSGDDGEFRFEPPAPGSYRLAIVTAEGYVSFAPAWGQSPIEFAARPGRRIEGVTLSLEKVPRLVGVVTTGAGEPVEGAIITTRAPAARGALMPDASTYTSDARGRFELSEPVGTMLEASHAEHGAATRPIMPFDRQAEEIRIELRGAAGVDSQIIAGRVVDEHDAPIADAQVVASRVRSAAWGDPWFWAVTGGDGSFEIDAHAGGVPYTLFASAPERASARKGPVEAGATELVLRLRADGGRIEGVVRAPDHRPAAGFAILVSQPLGDIEERSIATQSFYTADGRFELGPLEPGEYYLRAVTDGHAMTERQAVTVRDGERAKVSIQLGRGGQISGRVIDAETSAPIADAAVRVDRGPADATLPIAIERSALTGPDGRFEIAGVAPGRASVKASASGYHMRIASGLAVKDGDTTETADIELSPVAEGERPSFETESIGVNVAPHEDVLLVFNVSEGGGAAEAGLVPGDRIVAIDGMPLSELDMNAAFQMLRGPAGTTVSLRLRDADGRERDLDVPRRRLGP